MFVLDTNVVSALRRPGASATPVVEWVARQQAALLYISAVTILEIAQGALLLERRDHHQGTALMEWLNGTVLPTFENRILPFDTTAALRCAMLHVPNPRPERDAFIAATALVHNFTVVTRNTRDFEPMGVKLLNPWTTA